MRADWREKAVFVSKIRRALYDSSSLHGGLTLKTLADILSEEDHRKDPRKVYREMCGNSWFFAQSSGVWFLTRDGEEAEEANRKNLLIWECARDIANLLADTLAWYPGDFRHDRNRFAILETEITEKALERTKLITDEIVARINKQIGPLPEVDEAQEYDAGGIADTAIENAARRWLLARINGGPLLGEKAGT